MLKRQGAEVKGWRASHKHSGTSSRAKLGDCFHSAQDDKHDWGTARKKSWEECAPTWAVLRNVVWDIVASILESPSLISCIEIMLEVCSAGEVEFYLKFPWLSRRVSLSLNLHSLRWCADVRWLSEWFLVSGASATLVSGRKYSIYTLSNANAWNAGSNVSKLSIGDTGTAKKTCSPVGRYQ